MRPPAGSVFSDEDGEVFYAKLVWLRLGQYADFNSPVWFNGGSPRVYGCWDLSLGRWCVRQDLNLQRSEPD